MDTVTATFVLADWIAKGLASGDYVRIGGVIQEAGTKKVVAWLREAGSTAAQLPQRLQQAQGILLMGSTASVLNLGVSVMGFALVIQQLKGLEQRLQQAQEVLNKINRKIDLGYYANFRAALDLAAHAMTMKKRETRESMAIQAINRFLEAEHIYTDYTDSELEQSSQIADEYLLTLSLAYVAEARCYLELEEFDTARRRFQEGAAVIRSRVQRYVDILLTSNPAAYLHPQFKGQIDLRRLTRIYQWTDPTLDENAVFELQRENLVKLVLDPNKWVNSLPSAILDRVEVAAGWFGHNPADLKREADKRLPQVLEVVESVIETNNRFEAYQSEVQAIAELGVSFHDWVHLAPPEEAGQDGAKLMYIIPS